MKSYNIDKYAENTKRKTKKAKLPALSTLSPILPDAAAGISTFNASFGEELSTSEVEQLKSELEDECIRFMVDKGFDEEEIKDSLHININQYNEMVNITIKANLTISSLRELADTLYPITSQYDDESYFDISANNSISVELNTSNDYIDEGFKPLNITKKLKRLDRIGFDRHSKNYDFEALYESTKARLDNSDRQKLQQFLQTTDDPEKVNIFMKGLLMEDTEEVVDNSSADYTTSMDEIESAFSTLQDAINHLVGEANRNGNDSLRVSADLASGALDDFYDYLRDIQDELSDLNIKLEKGKLPSPDVYVDRFLEMYPTAQEYEDATGEPLKDYEVFDTIDSWIMDDVDVEDESLIEEIASEATDRIMGELG